MNQNVKTTVIDRPNKYFTGPKRKYIKHDGKMVMLDPSDVENWDKLLTVTIGEQFYNVRGATIADIDAEKLKIGTNELAALGEPVECEEWSRLEVIDYTTTDRTLTLKKFNVQLKALEAVEIKSGIDAGVEVGNLVD